eukprot:577564_1
MMLTKKSTLCLKSMLLNATRSTSVWICCRVLCADNFTAWRVLSPSKRPSDSDSDSDNSITSLFFGFLRFLCFFFLRLRLRFRSRRLRLGFGSNVKSMTSVVMKFNSLSLSLKTMYTSYITNWNLS